MPRWMCMLVCASLHPAASVASCPADGRAGFMEATQVLMLCYEGAAAACRAGCCGRLTLRRADAMEARAREGHAAGCPVPTLFVRAFAEGGLDAPTWPPTWPASCPLPCAQQPATARRDMVTWHHSPPSPDRGPPSAATVTTTGCAGSMIHVQTVCKQTQLCTQG